MEDFRKREARYLERNGYKTLPVGDDRFSVEEDSVRMIVDMSEGKAVVGIIEPPVRIELVTDSLVDAVISAQTLKEEFKERKESRDSCRLNTQDYEEIASDMMENIKEHIKDHDRGTLMVAGSSRYASVTADFTYNLQKGEILFVSLDNVECNFDDIDCEPLEIDPDELTAWLVDKIEDYNDRKYLEKECRGDMHRFFGVRREDFE